VSIETDPATLARIRRLILIKLDRAMKMNSSGTGTPAWKSIFFLLDHIARGDFYGTIAIRILGTVVKDPKYIERTFKVDEMYGDVERDNTRPLNDPEKMILAQSLEDISQAVQEVEQEGGS